LIGNVLTFTTSGTLVAGRGYWFKVRAINNIGFGPYSLAFRVYAAETPAAPTSF